MGAVRTTARGEVGLVTSRGRLVRLSALELPTLPPTNGAPSLSGGAPLAAYVDLPAGEEPLTLVSLATDGHGIALGTAQGVVKRVTTDYPGRPDFEIVSACSDGDEVVGAVELLTGTEDLVFITSDAQLLRFGAASVRPQGRAAGGMAGIKLGAGQRVVFFGAVAERRDRRGGHVVGVLGRAARHRARLAQGHALRRVPAQGPGHRRGALPPLPQGRGHPRPRLGRRRRPPARRGANGVALELPEATGRRDGSGTPAAAAIARIAGTAHGERAAHRRGSHARRPRARRVLGRLRRRRPQRLRHGGPRAGSSSRWSRSGRGVATPRRSPISTPGRGGRSPRPAPSGAGGCRSSARPGPTPDDHHDVGGHTAYLAWSGAAPWLLVVRVATPADLLDGRPRRPRPR